MVSFFRGISKYKSILLKTYNGSLTFCQGRGEGGAEKTTGGGAGDRREGWRVVAQGRSCVCVCAWVCCETISLPGWHESERCHHSKWFKALRTLDSLQVRMCALYRILGYTVGTPLFLPFSLSLSLSLCLQERCCVYFCVLLGLELCDSMIQWGRYLGWGCNSHVSDIYVLAWVAPLTQLQPFHLSQ